MGRKSSGSTVGNLILAALALGTWLILEQGKSLLILGAMALVAWGAYLLLRGRGVASESAATPLHPSSLKSDQVRRERPARVPPPLNGDDVWVPAHQDAEVQGRRIGGMVYVGRRLAGASGGREPALIDASLPASSGDVDLSLRQTNYWPA